MSQHLGFLSLAPFTVILACSNPSKSVDSSAIGDPNNASSEPHNDDQTDTSTEPPNDTSSPSEPSSSTGPCTSWGPPEQSAIIADVTLNEISGMVISKNNPDTIWVHEDSGAGPVVTAINTSGQTIASIALVGATSIDWEDMAMSPCGDRTCLWVGDIGDNANSRTDVHLLRFEEPHLDGHGSRIEVTPDVFAFEYADGPQDAEALIVDPSGQPYVLTKRLDATTHMYRIPVDETRQASRITTIKTGDIEGLPSATTAADLGLHNKRLVIRGYLRTIELDLSDDHLESAHRAPQQVVETGIELQGEAIAYHPTDRSIWHVGEGVNPVLWTIPCLE